MAVGELIGGAIGVFLLILVAYVLIGSTISTAEIVATAQKDLTLSEEIRLRSDISLTEVTPAYSEPTWTIQFKVKNTGNEVAGRIQDMDVFLVTGSLNPVQYSFGNAGDATRWNATSISPDTIHPHQLDPGETLTGVVTIDQENMPDWIRVTTGNGIYDMMQITT